MDGHKTNKLTNSKHFHRKDRNVSYHQGTKVFFQHTEKRNSVIQFWYNAPLCKPLMHFSVSNLVQRLNAVLLNTCYESMGYTTSNHEGYKTQMHEHRIYRKLSLEKIFFMVALKYKKNQIK